MVDKKHTHLTRKLLYGAAIICAVLLVISLYQYVLHRQQREGLDRMKDESSWWEYQYRNRVEAGDAPILQNSVDEPFEDGILEKYRVLHEINYDMLGWLAIEGTGIDYPVMQCMDDEYYLTHDFFREDSDYGCLFIKSTTDISQDDNFVIYGHNMKDGSMFGSLKRYEKEAYYKEHKTIAFDTLYGEYTFEVIAAFPSQVYEKNADVFKYYNVTRLDTQKAFDDFYLNVKELSLYDTRVAAQYGDRFLMLSTCSSDTEDGRFVVVAKRK